MDAFYAAVEVRDNPELKGRPLIIGALPSERGVVSTCSYEARTFGVHSGMSIKDAYRCCPQGIYMHPDMAKYKKASEAIHQIWGAYTNIIEYISLDEGYLDVTGSMHIFHSPRQIAYAIKARTKKETGLTCSVGVGYSMTSAKLASEEKKPDGFFEIPDKEALLNLIIDRDVRTIYGIGKKTAEKLNNAGIYTVRDIQNNRQAVIHMLGKHGRQVAELASGIDTRQVTPYYEGEAKSISREHTFQKDITDFTYLKDVLVLLAKDLSLKIRKSGLYCQTITLKVTYWNMKSITRSKSGEATNNANDLYKVAAAMLDTIDKKPIRLVGIGVSNLTDTNARQLTLEELSNMQTNERKENLEKKLLGLQLKFGSDIIKTGTELEAEGRLKKADADTDDMSGTT